MATIAALEMKGIEYYSKRSVAELVLFYEIAVEQRNSLAADIIEQVLDERKSYGEKIDYLSDLQDQINEAFREGHRLREEELRTRKDFFSSYVELLVS